MFVLAAAMVAGVLGRAPVAAAQVIIGPPPGWVGPHYYWHGRHWHHHRWYGDRFHHHGYWRYY
jgi:hypothetical protein